MLTCSLISGRTSACLADNTAHVAYHYPNDPTETERLENQYEIIKEMMDGKLYFAPFSPTNSPRKVLDIATGTGIWAIELGDEFPEAQVIGIGLSPIQPAFVPPNVRFFVEDSYVTLSQLRLQQQMAQPLTIK